MGNIPLILPASVVLLFNKEGELLLQRRKDDGKWGIPGGCMELGESYEETAFRELNEETGLVAKKLVFHNIFSGKEYINYYPNGDVAHNALAAYVCNEYEGDLKTDNESYEQSFFNVNELPTMSAISGKVVDYYKQNAIKLI